MSFKQVSKWLAFGLAIFISACSSEPELLALQGRTMGTSYHVKLVSTDQVSLPDDLKAELDRRLELVNDQMSTYRPDSELSRFNASRSTEPFEVSAATAVVVREALRIGELSQGQYDVTVGPLVNLWGFGPDQRPQSVPSAEQLTAIRARVGQDKLSVGERSLQKATADLYVDLSSIAKGWGVDVLADYLETLGVTSYMVEIGGELRTAGKKPDGQPWRIAIEKPDPSGQRAIQEVLAPGDNGLATSGDYRNYYEEDGVRYSHTINPATGRPIDHRLASVTVIHPSAMTADGLATAINVLGEEAGWALAEREQLAVFMVIKTDEGFKERYTTAFEKYLVEAPQ
ncbi:FAD:protein FMN transferase [Gallaecimonas sp. GXIMD4217]|uniref:FAD:protein FMN transferase n=1 Tax=Gallaecimonas sp. GXIMD4217 TaxID=3131927 RepID=UPI00311AC104